MLPRGPQNFNGSTKLKLVYRRRHRAGFYRGSQNPDVIPPVDFVDPTSLCSQILAK